jgi:Na+-transporting methylmalonyl-CoA/oxaloacetate decarboxylase gamma subunit
MIRFFRRLILLAVAVAIIALMIANRHTATLALDPFAQGAPAAAIEAPMFVFLFAALLVGFILGGIGAWVSQSKWRDLARRRTKETYRLRKDRERLARDLQAAQESGGSAVARLSTR